MDLHLIPDQEAGPQEREAIDSALKVFGDRYGRSRRHLLLPVLHAMQSRVGWISRGGLNAICARLHIPPAEAYGVASFYSLFSFEPRGERIIHVCQDLACRVNGSRELCAGLEERIGPADGTGAGVRISWTPSPCLGLCERAPAVLVQRVGSAAGDVAIAPARLEAVIGDSPEPVPPVAAVPQAREPRDSGLRLLRRVGRVDPRSLASYRKAGGYQALHRALAMGPEAVIEEVTRSRLLGRGGAAFPTGRKWRAVADAAARPHYVVCNADESEPGTFKDRVLIEEDPFAVIEAMTIAAFATGCERGFVYVRGEYPLAAKRLAGAIEQAREERLLGNDIGGKSFRFDVETRRGAGAYICGEETALFNSIEGFRGEPRNKPPFPAEVGLFGKPTLINNVETLANVLSIVQEGAEAFASVGTAGSTGTRLFCLSGRVKRPGLYEVPFGMTLRDLLDRAHGPAGGGSVQAVLLGGAAGVFLGPEDLDLPLTFEDARAAGATLGSGAVVVFDKTVDLADIVLRIAAFFRDESCGQCVPCRVGTVRQEEALHRLAGGAGDARTDAALLEEVEQVMRDASICGLGRTAGSAVTSALRKWKLFGSGGRP